MLVDTNMFTCFRILTASKVTIVAFVRSFIYKIVTEIKT